jgi:hypothetical protein
MQVWPATASSNARNIMCPRSTWPARGQSAAPKRCSNGHRGLRKHCLVPGCNELRISVRQGRYECLQRDFSLSVWLWESMPPALHWGSGSELPETPTSSILTKQKTYSLARRVILAVPRVRFSSAAFLLNSSAFAALTFISRHFRVARATASLIYDRSTCTEARRKMALLRIPLTTIADTQRGRSGVLCSSPALAARGGLLPVIRLD